MKRGYFVLVLSMLGLYGLPAFAQTTLLPGELAIINLQGDKPDAFIFLPLVDLDAGTIIYFTDCGSSAAGAFPSPCGGTEGAVRYLAPAGGITAGTVIPFPGPNFSTYNDSRITGAFRVGKRGDQIFAFQDANPANAIPPGAEPSFIFGLSSASNAIADCDETDINQTDAPTVLTGAGAYLAFGAGSGCEDEFQNIIFNALAVGFSFPSPGAALAAFTNPANWIGSSDPLTTAYMNAALAITGTGNFTLPVELTSFEALADGNNVLLQWATASETNNAGFSVEMQTPVQGWQELVFTEGFGTTNTPQQYRHTVAALTPGTYHFRLRQVDFDGAFAYSPQVEVVIGLTDSFRLTAPYPNPTTSEASFSLMVPRAQEVSVAVYDLLGRQVAQLHEGNLEAHHAKALMMDTTNLATGLYLIRAEGEAFVATQRLVVAR